MVMTMTGMTFGSTSVTMIFVFDLPDESGRVDEFLVGDADSDAPYVPREERDVDDGHRDQRVHEAGAEHGDDGQRQQDVGKGHQHVDAAHDDVVGPPAVIARHDADGGPERGGDDRGGEAHGEAEPGAPEKPAQEIAAEVVCAQRRAVGKRRQEAVGRVGDIRIGQRQDGRDERQDHDDPHHDQPAEREAVPRQKLQERAHVLILGSSRLCATSTMMLKIT
jgi:hypothetical protein